MGPVSFERIEGGVTRNDATSLARALTRAGVGVMSTEYIVDDQGKHGYYLMVRSSDITKARAVVAAHRQAKDRP